MAKLPSGEWMIQQHDRVVVLFHHYTEEEIVRFDPADPNAAAIAQKTIHDAEQLCPEDKAFAHFWSGYFYGCANG